jgi:uncharacterized membrane protein
MSHEEAIILQFLEENPETWFSRREVARKAVSREEYDANRNWASAAFAGLLLRGKIEENDSGHVRFKQRNW